MKAKVLSFMVKNLLANAWDIRDTGSIPRLGRSPGGGHGNPLQYSCLENPMDRGTCWATVHKVAKSQTQLKWLSLHTCYVYVYTHIHVFASQRHQIVYGIKDPDLIWLTFFTTRTPIPLLGDIPGTIFLRDVFHLCPCARLNFHLGNGSRWLGCKWKKKKKSWFNTI